MEKTFSLRKERESLILDFNSMEDWDSFEIIAGKIIEILNGIVVEKIDGPDSRVWFIDSDGTQLILVNNPYGNFLKAQDDKAKVLLHKIVKQF